MGSFNQIKLFPCCLVQCGARIRDQDPLPCQAERLKLSEEAITIRFNGTEELKGLWRFVCQGGMYCIIDGRTPLLRYTLDTHSSPPSLNCFCSYYDQDEGKCWVAEFFCNSSARIVTVNSERDWEFFGSKSNPSPAVALLLINDWVWIMSSQAGTTGTLLFTYNAVIILPGAISYPSVNYFYASNPSSLQRKPRHRMMTTLTG